MHSSHYDEKKKGNDVEVERLKNQVNQIIEAETKEEEDQKKREKEKQNKMCGANWKVELGKAVRFSGKIAKKMTMAEVVDKKEAGVGGGGSSKKKNKGLLAVSDSSDAGAETGVEAEDSDDDSEQDEMDDVIGSQFIEFAPLFTAYVYVCQWTLVKKLYFHTITITFDAERLL